MRDWNVATRDDHNPVISMRRYRRGDHVAPPKLGVSRCRARSKPITLHPIIVCEAVVVLLPWTLQVLLLPLAPSKSSWCSCPTPSESSSYSHPTPSKSSCPTPFESSSCPTLFESYKRIWKTINKFILQNGMKMSILPEIFESRPFDPQESGLCASGSCLACLSLKYNP
jgi:hypothetical protein